jgi:serum/glucocorticoid-regulated kinase 2
VILTQKCTGQEKGGLFAMKILRKSHLLKKQQIERTRTERKVLSIVDHPFIMKLHFAFQTEDKLFLILDYCAGGELFFHLSRHKKFSEGWTRFYTAELLLALGHLHSKGIIYRDLKPENILLDAKGHLKLGDFGLAKSHIRHPYEGAKSRVGTPEYMAPEVIKKQGHGFTVDYWGLGMVTYEMMTGLPPWYTDDRSKIFKRLLRAPLTFPVNTQISPPLLSFIASLLERSPHRRLGVRGVANVKNHPFFRRLDFKALEARRIDAPIRPCEGWRAPEPEKTKKSKLLGMFSSQRQANQTTKIKSLESEEVDAATANFDAQFTRMTLDSHASNDYGDEDDYSDDDRSYREELNANSFVGFTFDDPQNQSTAFDEVVNM